MTDFVTAMAEMLRSGSIQQVTSEFVRANMKKAVGRRASRNLALGPLANYQIAALACTRWLSPKLAKVEPLIEEPTSNLLGTASMLVLERAWPEADREVLLQSLQRTYAYYAATEQGDGVQLSKQLTETLKFIVPELDRASNSVDDLQKLHPVRVGLIVFLQSISDSRGEALAREVDWTIKPSVAAQTEPEEPHILAARCAVLGDPDADHVPDFGEKVWLALRPDHLDVPSAQMFLRNSTDALLFSFRIIGTFTRVQEQSEGELVLTPVTFSRRAMQFLFADIESEIDQVTDLAANAAADIDGRAAEEFVRAIVGGLPVFTDRDRIAIGLVLRDEISASYNYFVEKGLGDQ